MIAWVYLQCFLPSLGLERDKFDNKTVTFEEHIKVEHNMWHYLFFIVLVKVKDSTEYTGPESYVAEMIRVRLAVWNVHTLAPLLSKSGSPTEQRPSLSFRLMSAADAAVVSAVVINTCILILYLVCFRLPAEDYVILTSVTSNLFKVLSRQSALSLEN